MIRVRSVAVAFLFLCTCAIQLPAQSIYATLTGVVTDPSDALVVQASVKLRDMSSGSLRETVTNGQGYYTFASVPVGTYEITVSAPGFNSYRETGIALGGGERRNVNVTLKVGAAAETVEVTGTPESLVPVDSGEKSTTLTVKQLENFVQVGSNAAEFIKIMPGFGIQNGVTNAANYNGQTIGINANGNAGSQSPLNNAYAYNGLPSNTLDITADGAHVSDPGCNCDTPVNPNADMIAEFKITMSNFSAENQKGPAVMSSVAKSGGTSFHGSGFLYARDYRFNANDSLNNANRVARPENKYYYPGFTLGGPVIIPGTRLNRASNKLFFFTGYEFFYQVLDTGLMRAEVPTEGMLGGNFSPTELAKLGAVSASGSPPGQINARNAGLYPGGIIPASAIDSNMLALMKLYPKPNTNPQHQRRLQLDRRPAVQPEQSPVDDARRLQHQRQHEDVRPLQPAARIAALPGAVVVVKRHPAVALPDHGAGQEQVGFSHRLADARVQPEHDERDRVRLHLHRIPERV